MKTNIDPMNDNVNGRIGPFYGPLMPAVQATHSVAPN